MGAAVRPAGGRSQFLLISAAAARFGRTGRGGGLSGVQRWRHSDGDGCGCAAVPGAADAAAMAGAGADPGGAGAAESMKRYSGKGAHKTVKQIRICLGDTYEFKNYNDISRV